MEGGSRHALEPAVTGVVKRHTLPHLAQDREFTQAEASALATVAFVFSKSVLATVSGSCVQYSRRGGRNIDKSKIRW